MKATLFLVAAALDASKGMPLNCDKICASHWKPKELSVNDKAANYWMTMNQGVLSFLQKAEEPIDMGVTAAQCACMGITKITAKTDRELTGDEALDGRLLECDAKESDCKKCCQGNAAYRGCEKDQGEEACQNTCTMQHSDCEKAAEQRWLSLVPWQERTEFFSIFAATAQPFG